MISASQLTELIQTYRSQPDIFSSELDEHTRAVMADISEFTFWYLDKIASELDEGLNETEAMNAIKNFFENRWQAIKDSNMAYTRHPFLPANQLCLKLAAIIPELEESICSMLMPDVTSLNRISYSFKAESEDEGNFPAENFILNQDGTQLIPVPEILRMARINTNAIFPDFQPEGTALIYQMTTWDFLSLEKVAGAAGKLYIQALRRRHAACYDDNSLGFAIRTLSMALKKGSVEDAGTEMLANTDIIDDAIQTFHDIWRNLDEQIRAQVCSYRIQAFGLPDKPIDSYFLALFAGHGDCLVTPEEKLRQEAEQIFECVYQISQSLDEFLVQHQAALNTISVTPAQAAASSSEAAPDNLDHLLELALEALKKRPQSVDGNDQGLLGYFFYFLAQYESDFPDVLTAFSARLARHIRHTEDLQNLMEISPAFYHDLVSHAQDDKLDAFIPAGALRLWMNTLPEAQQQAMMTLRFEELFLQCRPRNNYLVTISTMSDNVRVEFKRLLVQKISSNINTGKTFCLLMHSYDFLANELYECPDKQALLSTLEFDDIASIFPLLNVKNKAQMILRYTDIIWPNINPISYPAFHSAIGADLEFFFHDFMATRLSAGIANLTDCLAVLNAWSAHKEVQKSLLTYLNPRLIFWIKDGENLRLFLSSIHVQYRHEAIKFFLHLINNQSTLMLCLPLIPVAKRASFLSELPLPSFINSVTALKRLAYHLNTRPDYYSVVHRFDPAMLRCTREEFNEITAMPVYDTATRLKKLRVDLTNYLRAENTYIERCPTTAFFHHDFRPVPDQDVHSVIRVLDSRLSDQDKFNAIKNMIPFIIGIKGRIGIAYNILSIFVTEETPESIASSMSMR